MIVRVYGEVADQIVEPCKISYMRSVESVCMCGKCGPAVKATVDENIVSCSIAVIRDTDLVCPVGSRPFTIVDRYRCTGRVEEPRCASILAGANIDVCEWWSRG